jgi:hypothetical protein
MKISIIHPSRSRAEIAHRRMSLWMRAASGEHHIEHILGLDEDDPQIRMYAVMFQESSLISKNNICVVEAVNHAAELAKGDILIYGSDDFAFPQNWDTQIINRINKKTLPGDKWMLRVNDGYQPYENLLLTIPIMSREMYKYLGYFLNPIYKSMWSDADLYMVTRPYMIDAPDLLFKHEKMANDDTYIRSSANFESGREIYNQRSRENSWPRVFNKMPS